MNKHTAVVVTEIAGGPNHYWTKEFLHQVPGDDWQLLLPAIPIEELPRYTMLAVQYDSSTSGVSTERDDCGSWVTVDDLQSIVPTRACDCEARDVDAELADKTEALRAANILCDALQAKVRKLEAELNGYVESHTRLVNERAELESELAGKWVLGEPLNSQAFDALDESTPLIVERFDGTLWQTMKSRFDWDEEDDYFRCLFVDTRPWPTLAEPEVPAVPTPKWLGCVRWVACGEDAVGLVFEINESSIRVLRVARDNMSSYTLPFSCATAIKHPEVPNTPELLAALNESEATE